MCYWLAYAERLWLLADNSVISRYDLHVHKVCHSLLPILNVLLCVAACNASPRYNPHRTVHNSCKDLSVAGLLYSEQFVCKCMASR